MEKNICIDKYEKKHERILIDFLQQCLPESNRTLDLNGRHKFYQDIENYFEVFWCMFDENKIVGIVAVKALDDNRCELKSLYLLERYHGTGWGRRLLIQALSYAKEKGWDKLICRSL